MQPFIHGIILTVDGGLWRYDGSTYTKVSQRGTSAIIEDKKGYTWTTGSMNANGVEAWKLLRYDQKSLYNKKAHSNRNNVKKEKCFVGFWKLTIEVFGLDLLTECLVMMERPSRSLKVKRVRNNTSSQQFYHGNIL